MPDSLSYSDFVMSSDSFSNVGLLGMSENLFDGPRNVFRACHESSVGSHDCVVVTVDKAGSLQNSEHFVDHSMVVSSSVVDDGMEAVYKLHVVNKLVHITLSKVDMTF